MRKHASLPVSLLTLTLALGIVSLAISGCGAASVSTTGHGPIHVVAAENQYGSVLSQIGGHYVTVSSIINNPNTDPHSFEASPSVANAISTAQLIVQNGLGYDDFMNRIESASPNPRRQVVEVQRLLGIPSSESNPHLWYSPRTMPAVATVVARAFARLDPRHQAYFDANARRFDSSLQSWFRALTGLRDRRLPPIVATSEPVADYLLQAAGARILTPLSLQLDIMNGVDPAPQNVSAQDALLTGHRVEAFLYNRQVTDSITQSFLSLAAAHHVPVVGVYETMPPGYDYQGWMLAETRALQAAVADGKSTRTL